MRALITGITGQTGSILAELLVRLGWDIHGLMRQRSDQRFLSAICDKITLHIQDIRDPFGVSTTMNKLSPDVIFHLAAISYVAYSWESPLDTFDTNVNGTINILEATRRAEKKPIVQFASSSEVYGAVPPDKIPITEDAKIYSASPYGISKYAGDLLFQQYFRSYELKTVITRAFNHTSPRRGEFFVSKQIVRQAVEIKHGKRRTFSLGNISSIRDFTDARDIAEAYLLAVTSTNIRYGEPYNVCSEKGYSVKQLVEIIANCVGVEPTIEQDPARMRPSDSPILLGSCKKFRDATGWSPKIPFEETLRGMVRSAEAEIE